jgi:uncharacterized membrane protein
MTNTQSHHPVVDRVNAERHADIQLRVADRVTAFAGSMKFVYLHAVGFGIWMVLFEKSPWPTLTLVVSLEAIFLSTFVMIGQNRQAAFQQAKADHDFVEEDQELKLNTELTREINDLTRELHTRIVGDPAVAVKLRETTQSSPRTTRGRRRARPEAMARQPTGET